MAKLLYSMIASLDGYIADEEGSFDWAEPDEEVFTFITDQERAVGTSLYGRRMYEMMTVWETDPALAAQSPLMRDWAEVWQAAEKIVYSTTLESVSTTKTRLERAFDPDAVKVLKASAERDLNISSPTLAAHALRAGLVDEVQLYVVPHVVGGGLPVFPGGLRLTLELTEERRFTSGTVYLRYQCKS
jgi:dihydrofolate reductase